MGLQQIPSLFHLFNSSPFQPFKAGRAHQGPGRRAGRSGRASRFDPCRPPPPRLLRRTRRDLAELAASGAIVPRGGGPQARYGLNHPAFEPIEGINEGINDAVLRLVSNHPGRGVPFFRATLKASRSSIERAVAALVAAGAIEHRGSRKTGGYWARSTPKRPPALGSDK